MFDGLHAEKCEEILTDLSLRYPRNGYRGCNFALIRLHIFMLTTKVNKAANRLLPPS